MISPSVSIRRQDGIMISYVKIALKYGNSGVRFGWMFILLEREMSYTTSIRIKKFSCVYHAVGLSIQDMSES